MNLLFFLFISLFSLSESYIFTNFFKNPLFSNIKEFNINDYNDFLKKNINNEFILDKVKDINMQIFKKVTLYLPDLHKSGDTILELNQKMIHYVLESNIDNELKKKIITSILDFTLVADHAASHFLHIYQDFVHHIM